MPSNPIALPTCPPELLAGTTTRYWGDREPPKDRAEIFSFSVNTAVEGETTSTDTDTGTGTAAVGSVATLRMYGPIDSWGGYWGVSAKDVASALDGLGDDVKEIRLRINSPGGECWEGLAILNMLRAHNATVVAVVDGVAASAASFIAAGCDETVMSPGTQMMIHDAWSSVWGANAAAMRKTADFLDTVSQACAELYAEAAGGTVESWRAAMVEETWYTAAESVTAGLANRVGVVKDIGTTSTSGDEPGAVVIPDEIEDRFDLSIFSHAGRGNAPTPAAAAALKPPTASAAGSHETEGGSAVAFSDEQITELRSTLGLADDADEAAIVAAAAEIADLAMEDAPKTATSTKVPEGSTMIESDVLAALREQANQGAAARTQQLEEKRDRTIAKAITDGKITPARQEHWKKSWDADAEGTEQTLAGLEPGIVPVAERGHDQTSTNAASAYDEIYGKKGV